MAKTLSQGRKPGSGRKPGKGKTLRNGRKPGSGRRRRDAAGAPPSSTTDVAVAAATTAKGSAPSSSGGGPSPSQVSSRDLEAIDALRELNNSPPQPLTPTPTPTQHNQKHQHQQHGNAADHTNGGRFVAHTKLLSNPSVSLDSLAQPQPVNGLVSMNSLALGEPETASSNPSQGNDASNGLLLHSYI